MQSQRGVGEYEEDDDEGSTGSTLQPAWRRQLGSMGRAAFVMLRVVVAQLAVTICQATGWELNAEEAWTRIQGRKVREARRGEARRGEARRGEARRGEARLGLARPCLAWLCLARFGSVWLGSALLGSAWLA